MVPITLLYPSQFALRFLQKMDSRFPIWPKTAPVVHVISQVKINHSTRVKHRLRRQILHPNQPPLEYSFGGVCRRWAGRIRTEVIEMLLHKGFPLALQQRLFQFA